MNVIELARLPLRYKPWRPRHLSLVWDSLRGHDQANRDLMQTI